MNKLYRGHLNYCYPLLPLKFKQSQFLTEYANDVIIIHCGHSLLQPFQCIISKHDSKTSNPRVAMGIALQSFSLAEMCFHLETL